MHCCLYYFLEPLMKCAWSHHSVGQSWFFKGISSQITSWRVANSLEKHGGRFVEVARQLKKSFQGKGGFASHLIFSGLPFFFGFCFGDRIFTIETTIVHIVNCGIPTVFRLNFFWECLSRSVGWRLLKLSCLKNILNFFPIYARLVECHSGNNLW